MNKIVNFFLLFILLADLAFAVSTSQTNLPVVDSQKDIYGKNYSGVEKQLVGINSSGYVSIDESGVGVDFGGAFVGSETFSGDNTLTGDNTFSSSTTAKPITTMKNTSTDATSVELRLQKDSSSPGNGDDLGRITAYTDNSSASAVEACEILFEVDDVATGSVDSTVKISVRQANTKINIVDIGSTAIRINEDSKDIDFIIESDTQDPAFKVDGGTGETDIASLNVIDIDAHTLSGKLTGGSNEIEGSNFDIDGGAIDGTVIGAASAAAGTFTKIRSYPGTSIDTSATTDATITPVNSFCIVDTHADLAISTVNTIATANFSQGSVLVVQTALASQDIDIIEGGNIILGSATRTLSDPADYLKLRLYDVNNYYWREEGFGDNN